MGEFSIFHWLVVLAIVLILFGGRKIPEVMKGLGEGIRNFKDGMAGSQTPGPSTSLSVAAPIGLTAKPANGQVSLHWNSSGAASYHVKRSGTSGGPYARIASTSDTFYTDGGLAAGTTFYYVVSSTSASGESENSLEVSATIA
ncbi:MAG TPA: twin-arginine translocase TatA/TatE family subunit [Candidatus Acidoferrum sp.]|nr:twin-arginine translocase TatA/TatE family subunit [Candidatus Acidoferrum sp.]